MGIQIDESLRVVHDNDITQRRRAVDDDVAAIEAARPKDERWLSSTPDHTIDVSGVPTPDLDGVVDEFERKRVLHELFGASSYSFGLGRYVITGTLGKGGMGVVFKAFDPSLDRRVALKVLHKELGDSYTTRILREAQALARLSHPNVVQVYEVGELEGRTFVVMELVRGQTLKEWMTRELRPSWRRCVEVFIQAGLGLAAAHSEGLVHRDFKPTNAIIDNKGRVRVLDFGLARQVEKIDEEISIAVQRVRKTEPDPIPLDVSLTKTGAVLGTPAYMPPEQMLGAEANARSDQFSFCVSLYEAVYGERPFEGATLMDLMISMKKGQVRPAPKRSNTPTALRTILLRGLASEPDQRWPSMEILLAELRTLVNPRRWSRWGLGGGLALGLALAGSVAYWVDMTQRSSTARTRQYESLQVAIHRHAQQLELTLSSIARQTDLLRTQTTLLLGTDAPPAEPYHPERYAVTTQGALYQPVDDGGASIFYSATTRIGKAEKNKIATTESLDPLLRSAVQNDPHVVAAYLNTHDNFNRYYPFLAAAGDLFPPNMQLENYAFYYAADGDHNPQRAVVWTEAYLDPAGKGWMVSAVAPVYRGDFLEGVVGLDVTLSVLAERILDFDLPYPAPALLLSADGTLLGFNRPAVERFAVGSEIIDRTLVQRIDGSERMLAQETPLARLLGRSAAKTLRTQLERDTGLDTLSVGNDEFVLASGAIDEPRWRIAVLIDRPVLLAPVTAIESRARSLTLLLMGGLGLLLILVARVLRHRSDTNDPRAHRHGASLSDGE